MILFISVSVIPSTGTTDVKQTTMHLQNGKTLYVGGSGPGNYTKIQDAINSASEGDTVFVYDDSSPYYENVSVDKSINLIGEDRDSTVIDGLKAYDFVVIVNADWVNISGFTIQNGISHGIIVIGENNNISGNIISDTEFSGIIIPGDYYGEKCDYNYIADNIFTNNGIAIILIEVSFTTVIGNIITNNAFGISLWSNTMFPVFPLPGLNSNTFSGNLISDNFAGAMEILGNNTLITKNTISNHSRILFSAVRIIGFNNTITHNNFINNIRNANVEFYCSSPQEIFTIRKYRNTWDGNYWGKSRSLPKIIFGRLFLNYIVIRNHNLQLPYFNFDWHPALKPYDI